MTLDRYEFFQQAFFVEDLEASIEQWARLLGAGPFVISPHHRTDSFDYRGTDHQADVSYAFGYLGDTMIQFIVQHDDTPSIYRDMYKKGYFRKDMATANDSFTYTVTSVPSAANICAS